MTRPGSNINATLTILGPCAACGDDVVVVQLASGESGTLCYRCGPGAAVEALSGLEWDAEEVGTNPSQPSIAVLEMMRAPGGGA